MNYALRNSLILAITLLILFGAGWFFLHWVYSSDIDELLVKQQASERRLEEVMELASLYDFYLIETQRARYIQDHYPKELFRDPNTGMLYDYIRRLNSGISFTQLNYSVQDSVLHDHHGVVRISVNGEGAYRNLYNFIHRIENSRPIIHINQLRIDNISEPNRLNRVNFQMTLHAYYHRQNNEDRSSTRYIVDAYGDIGHNPFFPLVHPVPPNEDDLVDVDQSRLLGMTLNFILIQDHRGRLHGLSPGDRVYLGTLERIDGESGRAVFRLNRGGLMDRVTLNLNTSLLTEPEP